MSLAGSARAAPCREVDGMASSRMLPLSVVNCKGTDDIKILKPWQIFGSEYLFQKNEFYLKFPQRTCKGAKFGLAVIT